MTQPIDPEDRELANILDSLEGRFRFLQKWAPKWAASPGLIEAYRLLSIIGIPLAGTLTLFLMHYVPGAIALPTIAYFPQGVEIPNMAFSFLPFPLAFALCIRIMEREERFRPHFSPLFCMLSVAGFSAATGLIKHEDWRMIALSVGVLSGLFVFIDIRQFIFRASFAPRLVTVTIIAAMCSWGYTLIQFALWHKMVNASAHVILFILGLFTDDISVFNQYEGGRARIIIQSPVFFIKLFPACSGVEGIFLFFFLLSMMVLLDWKLFKRLRLPELYVIGFLYMFFVNCLRILAFFLIGNWAHQPDASEMAKGWRDVRLELFHSSAGLMLYTIAFGVFLSVIYSKAGKKKE